MTNYSFLLQAIALGILVLAAGQALAWAIQLRRFRTSISEKQAQGRESFQQKLSRIQAQNAPQPAPQRAWDGEQVFRVASKTDLNNDTCLLELKPGALANIEPFLPGQHLFLSHMSDSGERILRCYSIINSPLLVDCYRLAVRRISAPTNPAGTPAGGMSTYVHDTLKTGDMVMVKAPAGHFFLRRDLQDTTPLLLIGLDIGILAILSIADTVRREQPDRKLSVVYVARTEQDIIHCDELQSLQQTDASNVELSIHYAETSNGLPEEVKVLLRQKAEMASDSDFDVYLAGYSGAVSDASEELRNAGTPAYAIRTEVYKVRRDGERRELDRRKMIDQNSKIQTAPESIQQVAPPVGLVQLKALPKVKFNQSEKSFSWVPSANSLLEFAEDQSIDMPSDCRMGSCHTCMTRLVSGEVDYVQAPYNEPDAGHCLPCIAIPKSDVELEV